MEVDPVPAGLFCQQATFHGTQGQVVLAHGFVICPHAGIIQCDQGIVLLDVLPFLDENIFDDAAHQVLNRLALGVDGDDGPCTP